MELEINARDILVHDRVGRSVVTAVLPLWWYEVTRKGPDVLRIKFYREAYNEWNGMGTDYVAAKRYADWFSGAEKLTVERADFKFGDKVKIKGTNNKGSVSICEIEDGKVGVTIFPTRAITNFHPNQLERIEDDDGQKGD